MEQRERLLALLEEALPGLRPLEEEDLPQVLALYQSNPEYNALALDSPPTLETCREDRTDLPPGRLPEHKLFLGYFQGERLAAVWDLVAGYPEESTLYLGLLELDGTHQRQGLGMQMLRQLEDTARSQGGKKILMDARVTAQPFYEAAGYHILGDIYYLSYAPVPHYHMEKDL